MPRLSHADLHALLAGLRDLYALDDLAAFPTGVLAVVRPLVPGTLHGYNAVVPGRQTVAAFDPPDAVPPDRLPELGRTLARCADEHPIIAYYRRTGDGPALKISDFLSRRQFHKLGLYRDFYRPLGAEYHLAVGLPAPPPLVIGLAVNRDRRDFTERDRAVLELLRPHLLQSYRTVAALTGLRQAAAGDSAVIEVDRTGRLRWATDRAHRLLERFFGPRTGAPADLPDDLRAWVRLQQASLAAPDDAPPMLAPLVVELPGCRLLVRFLAAGHGRDHALLVLREAPDAPPLTPREAEVLAWVAHGETDAQIAERLGISVRTVQKHLERLYRKLGVGSRTAAVARAAGVRPDAP